MTARAFPLIFARQVSRTADFYQRLGFVRHTQSPQEGEPTYVGLRRGSAEVAVVDTSWPERAYGGAFGNGQRSEMFIVVDDVDATVAELRRDDVVVLRDPVDTPWGERTAHVADPDGNPVALASPTRH